ncbi:hypothetical protein [Helicobacter brantae]|uniref:Uncharacterized protein n=1 Tax=Helicobacter brantae TaxID=375927 RepID=A0A3D8IZF8_9HELI|nr:hypothetical protein [Helicobacter brantae]RDU70662.1 hypothetical protein CQA58_04800 [Helicobacter brantae]
MYAIIFELDNQKLQKYYGENYHQAYDELQMELKSLGFEWKIGLYLTQDNTLTTPYKAISLLSKIVWFRQSLKQIKVFRLKDWSDFTEFFQEETI